MFHRNGCPCKGAGSCHWGPFRENLSTAGPRESYPSRIPPGFTTGESASDFCMEGGGGGGVEVGVPVLSRPRPTKVTTVHRRSPQKGHGSGNLLPQSLAEQCPYCTYLSTISPWRPGPRDLQNREEGTSVRYGQRWVSLCLGNCLSRSPEREPGCPNCLLIKTRKSFMFWDSSVNRPREMSPQPGRQGSWSTEHSWQDGGDACVLHGPAVSRQ